MFAAKHRLQMKRDHMTGVKPRLQEGSGIPASPYKSLAQMAQHFRIPLYSTGGKSDAKQVDIQGEFFEPRFANRDKRESMEPEADALSRARAFVQSARGSVPQSRLLPGIRGRILETYPEIRRS